MTSGGRVIVLNGTSSSGKSTLSRALQARLDGPWLGVGIGFLHVLGSAVWFGGVALVARVVLAGPGEEDLLLGFNEPKR